MPPVFGVIITVGCGLLTFLIVLLVRISKKNKGKKK